MDKKDTKADIIAAGLEIIARQGFNATGIDAVLKQAGVPKGSFYHYFGSKEEFGLAVIETFAGRYTRRLQAVLGDDALPPLQRLRTHLEGGVERLSRCDFTTGCLVGNLGQELAGQNERFRARLDQVLQSWRDTMAACLREAQGRGELAPDLDASVLAEFILSGWEGAVLRAKVMKSPQPMTDFIQILFAAVLHR